MSLLEYQQQQSEHSVPYQNESELLHDESLWNVSSASSIQRLPSEIVELDNKVQQEKIQQKELEALSYFLISGQSQPVNQERDEKKEFRSSESELMMLLCIVKCLKSEEALSDLLKGTIAREVGLESLFRNSSKSTDIMKKIEDAETESNCFTPIIFVIYEEVNLYQMLGQFMRNNSHKYANTRLHHITMTKGNADKIEDKIMNYSQSGDWLLIEYLNMAPELIPRLEDMLNQLRLKPETVSKKFRLCLSSAPINNFPVSLLTHSIIISLEQPRTIKQTLSTLKSNEHVKNFLHQNEDSDEKREMSERIVTLHAFLSSQYPQFKDRFDQKDLDIALNHCVKNDCLHYFETIYSSKLDQEQDLHILKEIIENFSIPQSHDFPQCDNKRTFIGKLTEIYQRKEFHQDEAQLLISQNLISKISFERREFDQQLVKMGQHKGLVGNPLMVWMQLEYQQYAQLLADIESSLRRYQAYLKGDNEDKDSLLESLFQDKVPLLWSLPSPTDLQLHSYLERLTHHILPSIHSISALLKQGAAIERIDPSLFYHPQAYKQALLIKQSRLEKIPLQKLLEEGNASDQIQ